MKNILLDNNQFQGKTSQIAISKIRDQRTNCSGIFVLRETLNQNQISIHEVFISSIHFTCYGNMCYNSTPALGLFWTETPFIISVFQNLLYWNKNTHNISEFFKSKSYVQSWQTSWSWSSTITFQHWPWPWISISGIISNNFLRMLPDIWTNILARYVIDGY